MYTKRVASRATLKESVEGPMIFEKPFLESVRKELNRCDGGSEKDQNNGKCHNGFFWKKGLGEETSDFVDVVQRPSHDSDRNNDNSQNKCEDRGDRWDGVALFVILIRSIDGTHLWSGRSGRSTKRLGILKLYSCLWKRLRSSGTR